MKLTIRCLGLVLFATCELTSCGTHRAGPKLITADQKQYVACGGAIWSRNDGDSKNDDTMTWMVIYADTEGKTRQIEGIHQLLVDTSSCAPQQKQLRGFFLDDRAAAVFVF